MTTQTLPGQELLPRLRELRERGIEPFRMEMAGVGGWTIFYQERAVQAPPAAQESGRNCLQRELL